MTRITRAELLVVVYRFYPRGLHNFARIYGPPNEPFYDDAEEHLRPMEAANRGRAEYLLWQAMTRRVPVHGVQRMTSCDPMYMTMRMRLTDMVTG